MAHSAPFRVVADIRRHWAVYLGLVIGLAIWCGVDVARRAKIDPVRPSLHMTDFTVYTEAGAAFFDGREPYDVTNVRGWKYLYPPLFALLVAPLAMLPPAGQAAVWFAGSALMALGCYFECRRLVSAFSVTMTVPESPGTECWTRHSQVIDGGSGRQATLVALFATSLATVLFPALNCLQRGQMGVALVYLLLLGFRLVVMATSPLPALLGGIVLALPIAFKLTPALPAGCALATLIVASLARRIPGWKSDEAVPPIPQSEFRNPHSRVLWPAVGLAAGLLLFFLVLPAALIGWSANLRHLETWYVRVASRVNDVRDDDFGGDVASFRNQSLHNAVYRGGNWISHTFFGGPDDLRIDVREAAMPMDAPIVSRLLSIVRVAALAAVAAIVLIAGRSGQPLLYGVAFGLAGVATLVVSPVSRGHYFVFWLPAVVFVPLWFQGLGRHRVAATLAVVPAILTLAHYAFLPYAGRMGLLGIGTTLWLFAAAYSVLASDTTRLTTVVEPSVSEVVDSAPLNHAA